MNRKHGKHQHAHCHKTDNFTLDKVEPNQTIKVRSIIGGWHIRQRLDQLGIYIGIQATVKQGGPFGGPVLLSMRHSTIALGRRMASHIIVELVDQT